MARAVLPCRGAPPKSRTMVAMPSPFRLAFIGEDLIVFDLEHDRYLALPGALIPRDRQGQYDAPVGFGRIDEAYRLALAEIGIVEAAISKAVIRMPQREMECPEVSFRIGDPLRLAIALIRVGWRLSRGRHVRRFCDDRPAWYPPRDETTLRNAIGSLRRLRLFVPTPRRCLPRALVTALFLRDHDIVVDFVFGVRAHPFDAHCWLEWNGMVVDDELDRVRHYTPIAIGRA